MKELIKSVFCIIDIQEAKEKNMQFVFNVYGDSINKLNCRSIWRVGNLEYRVRQLHYGEQFNRA